ncbi:MAG: class I SAM-dependent methyltransferase, partial [Gammaproteobacteria bacterium]
HTLVPFIHWLPQPLHQALLRTVGKEFWSSTETLNLLTSGSMRKLFPKCAELSIRSLRLFGWPSNILAYGRK